jgi:hypothetical protein
LEKISEMNGSANRQAVESSRLWEGVASDWTRVYVR